MGVLVVSGLCGLCVERVGEEEDSMATDAVNGGCRSCMRR